VTRENPVTSRVCVRRGDYFKNVFTLASPFTITRKEIDPAIELLDQLLRRCVKS
jgi:4-aminobutyrate aminotransferase-like enzyme